MDSDDDTPDEMEKPDRRGLYGCMIVLGGIFVAGWIIRLF